MWLASLVLCLGSFAATQAQVTPTTPTAPLAAQPIPWRQRTLFIPYHLNTAVPATKEVAQVQLLVSRTGSNDWEVLQSARPEVEGFNYHAPEDGEYWFALRHLDASGQMLDRGNTVPQLHLVIDTQSGPAPAPLNIPPGATDLAPQITGSETAQPRSPFDADAAPRSPTAPMANPFQSTPNSHQTAANQTQDWPANNQLPMAAQSSTAPHATATQPPSPVPPIMNPYMTAVDSSARRVPARFAMDGGKSTEKEPSQDFTTNLLHQQPQAEPEAVQGSLNADPEWSSAGPQSGPMLVNARTFDVDYDLQAVGSWGVAKVELWGTQDEGATWQSFGVDPDNCSPMRVTVPHSGTFGFRILVEGANSFGVRPPQPGDKPELVVLVDLEPPLAEIEAVEPGAGDSADQLRIRWHVADKNLEPRPIGLFYSSYSEGPWTVIASGIENTGSYAWRIERHIPGRLFLKLEARDTAGNVATYQIPQPIELDRPQPTATLRSIHPITDAPVVDGNQILN